MHTHTQGFTHTMMQGCKDTRMYIHKGIHKDTHMHGVWTYKDTYKDAHIQQRMCTRTHTTHIRTQCKELALNS